MIGHSQATFSTGIDQYWLPISQIPCIKMTNSLLVNVDIPIDTKRLVRISLYPCKIDLDFFLTIRKITIHHH